MYGRLTNTWYPVTQLRDEMDRLFDEVLGEGNGGWTFPGRFRTRAFPAVNLWETEDAVFAEAEVPGLTMEDIELLMMGNELTIRGERKPFQQEGVTYHRRERGTGTFSRVIRLPIDVDSEKVEASLETGVLTIRMPKAETARPRKIEVKASSA